MICCMAFCCCMCTPPCAISFARSRWTKRWRAYKPFLEFGQIDLNSVEFETFVRESFVNLRSTFLKYLQYILNIFLLIMFMQYFQKCLILLFSCINFHKYWFIFCGYWWWWWWWWCNKCARARNVVLYIFC